MERWHVLALPSIRCSWIVAKDLVGRSAVQCRFSCCWTSCRALGDCSQGWSLPRWMRNSMKFPVGKVPVSTLLFTADESIICSGIFQACTPWLNICKPGFNVQKSELPDFIPAACSDDRAWICSLLLVAPVFRQTGQEVHEQHGKDCIKLKRMEDFCIL